MSKRRLDRVMTLRLPAPAARRLAEHARSLGTTPSALVRDLVDREIGATSSGGSLVERTQAFVGAVCDARVPHGRDASAALEAWAPDRRG